MEYDEIRITTRREIAICEGAISKLEREIEAMEERYGLTGPAGFQDGGKALPEFRRWRESRQALERWQQRLHAHRQIMKL